MIDIVIRKNNGTSNPETYEVTVPALPPIGAYLSSDRQPFSGYVTNVMYWWGESYEFIIEVTIE